VQSIRDAARAARLRPGEDAHAKFPRKIPRAKKAHAKLSKQKEGQWNVPVFRAIRGRVAQALSAIFTIGQKLPGGGDTSPERAIGPALAALDRSLVPCEILTFWGRHPPVRRDQAAGRSNDNLRLGHTARSLQLIVCRI